LLRSLTIAVRARFPARVNSARGAGLHPAVSQICNLLAAGFYHRAGNFRRLAECNSAIRQFEKLRYAKF